MPTPKKNTATLKARTLGQVADEMWALREDKRKLESTIKQIETRYAELEEELTGLMAAQQTSVAKGQNASVSLGEPQVFFSFDEEHGGFDAFVDYVRKHKFFHLFQRRVSDVACREIFEQKGAIPGLKHFTKRKLSVKTVS